MHRRRITRTLGAAAGGLLGAAFLPAAAAFAETTRSGKILVPQKPHRCIRIRQHGSSGRDRKHSGISGIRVLDTTSHQVVGTLTPTRPIRSMYR